LRAHVGKQTLPPYEFLGAVHLEHLKEFDVNCSIQLYRQF